jgi:hypothetical protein
LIGSLLPQIADNFIFLLIFQCIDTPLKLLQKEILIILVFPTMYCTWTLQYALFPFFINVNAKDFIIIKDITAIIYVISSILYNYLLTIHFYMKIYHEYKKKLKLSSGTRVFCYKCCIHFITR